MKKALTANILLILTEIAGVILSVAEDPAGWFAYYTDDSNLFALLISIIFVIYALRGEVPSWVRKLRFAASSVLLVTFTVVVCILCPAMAAEMGAGAAYLHMLTDGAMLFHHLLCPLLSAFSFIFLEEGKPDMRDNLLITVPTLVYGVIAMTLNGLGLMDGPYPFLRVNEQSPIMTAVWILLILSLAYLMGFILRKLNGKFRM